MPTDRGIAASLALQRRGFRVVVEQERGNVTVYLGRRGAPITEDMKTSAPTLAAALGLAATKAGVKT